MFEDVKEMLMEIYMKDSQLFEMLHSEIRFIYMTMIYKEEEENND